MNEEEEGCWSDTQAQIILKIQKLIEKHIVKRNKSFNMIDFQHHVGVIVGLTLVQEIIMSNWKWPEPPLGSEKANYEKIRSKAHGSPALNRVVLY